MCGIAGIWGEGGDIQAMMDILAHRGPDDEGCFVDGDLKLGARRLAIIDLEGGHQPLANESETIWLVYNGEIYNFPELRRELDSKHRFRTKTDSEVIIHAYEEWGIECLERFNGMFAFALWDGRPGKRRLFLARDRMGEKPLYYLHRDGLFLFASEIKSLLTQVDAEPNLVEDYEVFEATIGETTLFKDIKALPPATYLLYDGETLTRKTYWDLTERVSTEHHRENRYIEELRWLVEDAVRIRLRSDVPLGIYVSGGVDSSLIACLAKPDLVFTCRFPLGPAYDEYEYARLVSDSIGAKMYVVQPTAEDFRTYYPRMLWHLDQPVASSSSIAEYLLAREASRHVKVILSGQGADELFGGYIRYLLMVLERRLQGVRELEAYHPLMHHFWTPDLFGAPEERYFHLIKRGEPTTDKPLDLVRQAFERFETVVDQMGYCDILLSLPSLITMADRAAGAWGIENRLPFLDHRLVEFAFSLPPEMKIREMETKYLLKQAARGIVPEAVLDRKDKKGLVVPINRWLEGPLKGWSDGLLEGLARRIPLQASQDRGEFDRRRYSQLSLELWWRMFIEPRRQDPETPEWRRVAEAGEG
ncbi:MAG: asparagine synthase (glutamine-hydrolyzing) [bacterium]|nr:asparagine synthase (glutamine-hydrolyzing) [bacterium]